VDDETGQSLFESGVILLYLAEKTGLFLPQEPEARWTMLQWLMWQMGGFGPMLGQTHHFKRFAKEKLPYAIERYDSETRRLYGVLDKRLGEERFLAGDEYGIADIATWPWVARFDWHRLENGLDDFPNVKRWFNTIADRPAVQRGYDVPETGAKVPRA
jgi:GST-like protein